MYIAYISTKGRWVLHYGKHAQKNDIKEPTNYLERKKSYKEIEKYKKNI